MKSSIILTRFSLALAIFLAFTNRLIGQSVPGSITNSCPTRTANLATITPVSGSILEWHTVSSNPSASTRISLPSSVGAGVYYLFALSAGVYTLQAQTQVVLTECTPQPAYSCPSTAFFVQDSPSDFYSLNLATGQFTLERNNILPPGGSRQIQAIGYNPIDNFIYGYRSGSSDLVRIGSDYSYQLITIASLPVSGYDNGDIDAQGILYLTNGSTTIKRIDLNPNSPTYLQNLADLTTTGTTISDWGVNPVDGNLYAINQSSILFRYNKATGARTTVGTVQWPVATSNGFGGVFFDTGGNLFVFDNNTGQTLKVAATQSIPALAGSTIQGTLFLSTGVPVTSSDAARCPTAPAPCPPTTLATVVVAQPTCTVSTGSLTVSGYSSAYGFRINPSGGYQASPVFSAVSSGNYSLQVQETITGCVVGTALVGINAAPVMPSSPVLSALPTSICLGVSTELTATGCTGTVNWSTGETGPSITVAPTANASYTATCTVGSCVSTAGSVTVTVNPIPAAPTLSAAPSAICAGGSTVLTAAGCNGIVNWSTGETGPSITVAPTINTSYSALCRENNCESPSGSVSIIVNEIPTAPTLSAAQGVICSGGSTVLSSAGCAGIVTWSTGEIGPSITVSPTANATFTATCSLNNCVSSAGSVGISVNPIPSPPTLSASPAAICLGTSTQLTASGCGGIVLWSTGDVGASVTVSPTINTTYTATCEELTCLSLAGSVEVTVNPIPSAPVLHNLTVCQGETALLTPFGCAGTVSTLASETTITAGAFSNTITSFTMVCNENGCLSDPGVGSITYLQIPAFPVITADGPTVGVCEGSGVSLNVTSCAGGNVTWSNGLFGDSAILYAQPGQSYSVRCFNGSCGSVARPIQFQRP